MEKSYPKISVVIPSFNQGAYIEETILSIINQEYPNVEIIIIDGGSTDSTISIIKKYSNSIHYFISEKDKGQAHALNKGFAVATGDICSFLNSDDLYIGNIFWEIGRLYLDNNFKWVSSDILIGYSKENSEIWKVKTISYELFCAEQTIGQQGVFWENNCFKNVNECILKLQEEIQEFKEVLKTNNKQKCLDEGGDILFASINILRKTGINSQEALEYANNKFTKRYNYSEILAKKENKNFAEVSLEEKHKYWLKSKKINL